MGVGWDGMGCLGGGVWTVCALMALWEVDIATYVPSMLACGCLQKPTWLTGMSPFGSNPSSCISIHATTSTGVSLHLV